MHSSCLKSSCVCLQLPSLTSSKAKIILKHDPSMTSTGSLVSQWQCRERENSLKLIGYYPQTACEPGKDQANKWEWHSHDSGEISWLSYAESCDFVRSKPCDRNSGPNKHCASTTNNKSIESLKLFNICQGKLLTPLKHCQLENTFCTPINLFKYNYR